MDIENSMPHRQDHMMLAQDSISQACNRHEVLYFTVAAFKDLPWRLLVCRICIIHYKPTPRLIPSEEEIDENLSK